MAEYQDRTGYNVGIVGGSGGSEPADTIEAQWIRKLERDLWIRFWGPGPICTDWDDKNEYERSCGWNQSASYDAGTSGSGTSSAGMGDMSGNPYSHVSAGGVGSIPVSTSDPRDAYGYGKFTVLPNITNASKANPCRVTCVGHGLLDEAHEGSTLSAPNYIQIVRVPSTSMYQLNEQYFYAKVIDADTLDLYDNEAMTVPHDSSSYQVWAGSEGHINFVIDFVAGTGDTGNYERTTTIARDQYVAIQQRINAAIKRTGQSTFATGNSKKTLDLATEHGAMRKSDGSPTTDILEDMGRVRDDHVNAMSDEIERIGGAGSTPPNTSSLGGYNFHKLHVDGIYAPYSVNNKDTDVYSENIDQASGSFSNNWGSDNWDSAGVWSGGSHNIPWSDSGGTEYGNDRPFLEARMTFLDWNHMRYWFNQGGCCAFHPDYTGSGSYGSWMWQNLAKANNPGPAAAKVFIGQFNPYHENAALISTGQITFRNGGSGNGWTVTGDCPRVHGLGDKSNAYFTASGGATSNGTTITVSSSANMAQNDILHIGPWLGEIETITDATTVELYRKMRKINGTEYDPDPTNGDGPLTNLDIACSKWYRACQYDGNAGLYGDNNPFPNNESISGDAYIHFDWRFVKDHTQSNKPCIFYRMMYDNASVHATVHGTGTMRMGSRWADTVGYFYPEQGANPTVTKDNASTAEGHDGFNRI